MQGRCEAAGSVPWLVVSLTASVHGLCCRYAASFGADGTGSGILDRQPEGACTQQFPLYGTSRIVAGAPIEGGIYSCARKPVRRAVADGLYAPWARSEAEVQQLEQIHAQDVCDYTRPDQARPG